MHHYIMVVMLGLSWSCVGVIFSKAAEKKINFISFMALSSIITMFVAFMIIPKYSIFLESPSTIYFRAVPHTLMVGVSTALGVICMNKAMKIGHHGATWSLVQSALIIPFLFGIFIWNEDITILNIAGLVVILISILLFGIAKNGSDKIDSSYNIKWLFFSLVCLIFFGSQQVCMAIPSRWTDWQDSMMLRVPFIQLSSVICYNTIMIIQRKKITLKVWRLAILLSCVMIMSQLLLFETLDTFAQFSKTSLVFPIGIGVSMIAFSLYSLLILKEKTNFYNISGMVFGTLGIALVAIK